MEKPTKKELKDLYSNRIRIGGVYCIKCSGNDACWIKKTKDIEGSKNRFLFSISINSCPDNCMIDAWQQYGKSAFSFEILEELKKKETQTEREFTDDINTLLEIWKEKR